MITLTKARPGPPRAHRYAVLLGDPRANRPISTRTALHAPPAAARTTSRAAHAEQVRSRSRRTRTTRASGRTTSPRSTSTIGNTLDVTCRVQRRDRLRRQRHPAGRRMRRSPQKYGVNKGRSVSSRRSSSTTSRSTTTGRCSRRNACRSRQAVNYAIDRHAILTRVATSPVSAPTRSCRRASRATGLPTCTRSTSRRHPRQGEGAGQGSHR